MTTPAAGADEGSVETIAIPPNRINELPLGVELAEAVRQVGRQDEVKIVSVDLKEVGHLGSIGLNHLIQLNRVARNQGLAVELTNVRPPVKKVMTLTRLERLFKLKPLRRPNPPVR